MKILLTTVSLNSERGGGTAERTRLLALHLGRLSHDCAVATIEGGDIADRLRHAGIRVFATGFIRLRFTIPLLNPASLARHVRNAEVIHILGYWNLLSVTTAWLAWWYDRPYVLSAAGEFAKLERPRSVDVAFHGLFGRRMIRHASALVAITELEKTQIVERLGVPDNRVMVVPNGVDEEGNMPDPDTALPDAPFLLFMGRLAHVKGPDLLLKAFGAVSNMHPDVHLVFAGPDFGLKRELEEIALGSGISSKVHFTGHLGIAQRAEAYRRAMALVVPSRSEAMSLVALEAAAAGKPLLLSDQCGFADAAAVGGGLVVPATITDLRDGLLQLLRDRAELGKMGQRMKAHVAANFGWAAIVSQFAKKLESLRSADGKEYHVAEAEL